MNNILDKICKNKFLEITEAKKKLSLDELKQNIKKKEFAFSKQIDNFKINDKTCLIAEIKKASPSKGIFRENFNHVNIAKDYINGGVGCLSIITENFLRSPCVNFSLDFFIYFFASLVNFSIFWAILAIFGLEGPSGVPSPPMGSTRSCSSSKAVRAF